MTHTFNRVLIAGETTPALNTRDIAALISAEFNGAVDRHAIDLSRDKAEETMRSAGLNLISTDEIAQVSKWGPEGADTWLVADHASPKVNPVQSVPQLETGQGAEIGGVGTLLALAGLNPRRAYASAKDVIAEIVSKYGSWSALAPGDEVWFQNRELMHHVRSLALQNIGNRRLHVASATERPLLGLDSTLAMAENGQPVNVIEPQTLGQLTKFYTVYTQIGEAEKLSNTVSSYARQIGSGGGLGIGALALGLRGTLSQLSDVLIQATGLQKELASSDLLIEIIPQLHPQTVADSPLQKLGELAAELAIPVIVFTHESSLSNHELAEWGIHASYVVDSEAAMTKVKRVLKGTWIRPS